MDPTQRWARLRCRCEQRARFLRCQPQNSRFLHAVNRKIAAAVSMVVGMLPLLSVGVHLTGMNCYDGKHTYDPAIHAGKPICVSRATALPPAAALRGRA